MGALEYEIRYYYDYPKNLEKGDLVLLELSMSSEVGNTLLSELSKC